MESKKKENTENEQSPLIKEEWLQAFPTIVSYRQFPQAFKEMYSFSSPYVISRLAASILGIANAIVIAYLDKDSIAAAPLVTGIQFSIIGTARGGLLAIGILGGQLNGEISKKNAILPSEIGNLLTHGWLLSSMISVPAIAFFLNSGRFLELLAINSSIADRLQEYFYGYAIGVFPFLLNVSDQQFALAIKRSKITLVVGISYAALTMLTGYPLVFGFAGLPKMGIAGIGIGYGISAWVNLIALRLYYYFNSDFHDYQLFQWKISEKFLSNMSKLIKKGVPLALQRLSEWGNITVLLIMLGMLDHELLIAAQPSIQLTVAVSTALLAIAQSAGVNISNLMGRTKKFLGGSREDKFAIAEAHCKKTKVIGDASIALGLMIASGVATSFFAIPDYLTKLFVHSHNHKMLSPKTISIARNIFYINGASLIVDNVRNVSAGALRGYNDMSFAPIVSVITMSIIGLTVGYLFASFEDDDKGAEALFLARLIGITLAAFAIFSRWKFQNGGVFKKAKAELGFFSEAIGTTAGDNSINVIVEDAPEPSYNTI